MLTESDLEEGFLVYLFSMFLFTARFLEFG